MSLQSITKLISLDNIVNTYMCRNMAEAGTLTCFVGYPDILFKDPSLHIYSVSMVKNLEINLVYKYINNHNAVEKLFLIGHEVFL